MDWERGTKKGPFNFLCPPSDAFSYCSWSGLFKRQAQLCHAPPTFKILKWLFIILKTKIKSLNRTCTALHDVTRGRIKMPTNSSIYLPQRDGGCVPLLEFQQTLWLLWPLKQSGNHALPVSMPRPMNLAASSCLLDYSLWEPWYTTLQVLRLLWWMPCVDILTNNISWGKELEGPGEIVGGGWEDREKAILGDWKESQVIRCSGGKFGNITTCSNMEKQ